MFSAAIAEMNAFYDSLRVPRSTSTASRPGDGSVTSTADMLNCGHNSTARHRKVHHESHAHQADHRPQITKLRNHAVYAKYGGRRKSRTTLEDRGRRDHGRPGLQGNRSPGWIAITAFFNYSVGLLPTVSSGRCRLHVPMRDVRSWRSGRNRDRRRWPCAVNC